MCDTIFASQWLRSALLIFIERIDMLYQRLAIYLLKAEYIIQVMNSAVKDK